MTLGTALSYFVASWFIGWAWGKLAAYVQRFLNGELFI